MRIIKHYTSNYIVDSGTATACIIATQNGNSIRFKHFIRFKAARSGVIFKRTQKITVNAFEWLQVNPQSDSVNVVDDFINSEGLNILKAGIFSIADTLTLSKKSHQINVVLKAQP